MENVYLLRGIVSIPAPLFKRGGHFVARFLQFCCRWRKNRLRLLVDMPRRGRLRVALSGSCFAVTGKSRGFARSGALGQPGAGHGLASLSGRINEVPEWCFALAADYSISSPAIKIMGSVTGAVTTRPTPSAVLPKRVKGASTATAVSMLRG